MKRGARDLRGRKLSAGEREWYPAHNHKYDYIDYRKYISFVLFVIVMGLLFVVLPSKKPITGTPIPVETSVPYVTVITTTVIPEDLGR